MSDEKPDALPKLPWWQRWAWLWLMCWAVWWAAFLMPEVTLNVTGAWNDGLGEVWEALSMRLWVGETILAVVLFVPLALLLVVAWLIGTRVRPSCRWLVLMIPTLSVCGWWRMGEFRDPSTSQRQFAEQLGFSVPVDARNYRGWHLSSVKMEAFAGTFAVYRMELAPAVLGSLLKSEKGIAISQQLSQEQAWRWDRWTDYRDWFQERVRGDVPLKDPAATVYQLTNEEHVWHFRYLVTLPHQPVTYWVVYNPSK